MAALYLQNNLVDTVQYIFVLIKILSLGEIENYLNSKSSVVFIFEEKAFKKTLEKYRQKEFANGNECSMTCILQKLTSAIPTDFASLGIMQAQLMPP